MSQLNKPSSTEEIVALLKETTLFANQKEELLATIAADFRLRSYRKGEILFHQGDENSSMFVVMSGKVRVYHTTPDGAETTVNILARRRLLGEFAVIDSKPRSATAQAITACTLLSIHAERCLYHLEHVPGLALAMCRQLVYKARWTSMVAETIARLSAEERLLHFLLLYNEEFGREIEKGKRYEVDLGLNQSDLATLVGANRGWVNGVLSSWKRRGLVQFEGGVFTILEFPQLQISQIWIIKE